MKVVETFFALEVAEMERAVRFWTEAMGASVEHATPDWTSLRLANVRIGLSHTPGFKGAHTGLHLAVTEYGDAAASLAAARGSIVSDPTEVAPGVVLMAARDSEGNGFTLTLRGGS
jgi:predicted enzyme related to lactoylglutathione lyase